MSNPRESFLFLQGKTCLVTGATSGIGLVAASALAGLGAEVVITGRRSARLDKALRRIQAEHPQAAVHALLADFADLDQVRGLTEEFRTRFNRLDVLVNNAGTYYNQRHATPYNGVERTFVVNHLASFLLTNLLLDRLVASTPARIVNVSSGAHKSATLDFDDLGFRHGYFGMKAYSRSKLANILFTYELARRLAGSGVAVNAVNPGQVATDIWSTNFSIFGPLIKGYIRMTGQTPEQGATLLIYLAASPEVEGVSGEYFSKGKSMRSSELTYDKEVARRLWQVSENLAGLS